MHSFSLIPPAAIPHLPRVIEYLKRVEKYSLPRSSASDIYCKCVEGISQLWGVFSPDVTAENANSKLIGVVVTSVTPYPRCRMLTVVALSGDNMNEWLDDVYERLTQFRIDQDCIGIEEIGRTGWLRQLKKYGFQQVAIVMDDCG